MSRIDAFLDTLETAFAQAGDKDAWPMHVAAIAPYFGDIEAADLFTKAKRLAADDVPLDKVRALFIGPSVTRSCLFDVIAGLKEVTPPITADERVWFVEYMFDVIQGMMHSDMLCRDGKHLLLNPQDVLSLCNQTSWIWLESEPDVRRPVYRLSASAHALMWSLYFWGWSDVGFEFHGPYDVTLADGKKFQLVVRDFFDTRPTLLWESLETFPYRSIRIMALYDCDADLEINVFNHILTTANLPDRTVALYVEANGKAIHTKDDVEHLLGEVSSRILEQHRIVRGMSDEEIVRKYVLCRYYAFRKLRMHFHEDWRPPDLVSQRIGEWGLIEIPDSGPPPWELLRKAFDPRDDFVLGPPPD